VRFGPVLACLQAERLAALRQLVDKDAATQPGQPLAPGNHVIFCSGPLKGASGIVSHVASERVTVLMSLLGRDQTVATTVANLACGDAAP
jgi:transcription antitermination factor NusG